MTQPQVRLTLWNSMGTAECEDKRRKSFYFQSLYVSPRPSSGGDPTATQLLRSPIVDFCMYQSPLSEEGSWSKMGWAGYLTATKSDAGYKRDVSSHADELCIDSSDAAFLWSICRTPSLEAFIWKLNIFNGAKLPCFRGDFNFWKQARGVCNYVWQLRWVMCFWVKNQMWQYCNDTDVFCNRGNSC